MARTRFDGMNCSVAQALDILGDGWTLLILRDAFAGARRFGQFERNLGIAKNILSNRLGLLLEHGVLERVDVGTHGEHFEYRLTEKGEALLPVLTALREWADTWVYGPGSEPVIVRDRRTRKRVPTLRVRDAEGRVLERRDLRMEAGPGANAATRRLFAPRR